MLTLRMGQGVHGNRRREARDVPGTPQTQITEIRNPNYGKPEIQTREPN